MKLPDTLPGHWDSANGREMAERYASEPRERLGFSEMTDFAFANAQFMADRYDLNLISYQTAAKERIRWLSVQLAIAKAEIERLTPKPSEWNHLSSAIYREGPVTAELYDEAIEDLQNAKRALVEGDNMGCAVCEDSGHSAGHCHHNPLLLARKWVAATRLWQCWHCGYIATNDEEGRAHFGASDDEPAACQPRKGPCTVDKITDSLFFVRDADATMVCSTGHPADADWICEALNESKRNVHNVVAEIADLVTRPERPTHGPNCECTIYDPTCGADNCYAEIPF